MKLMKYYQDYDYKIAWTIKDHENLEIPDLRFKHTDIQKLKKKDHIKMLSQTHKILGYKTSFPNLEYYLLYIRSCFYDYDFVYILTNISISLAAIALQQAFFYSLLLLDIINHFDILQNVLKSVTMNVQQLSLSALLGGLFIYMFTLIGFTFFPEDFFMDSIGIEGERTCTSLYRCFLHITNLVS